MSEQAPESTPVAEAIEALLQPLRELDQKLALQEAHIVNELDEVRGERRKVRAMLRAADPDEPGPGRRKKVEETANQSEISISEHAVGLVLLAVGQIEGQFTSVDLRPLVPESMGKDTIRKGLIRLRERGMIRLVKTGRGPAGANVYLTTPRGREDAANLAKHQDAVLNGSEPS